MTTTTFTSSGKYNDYARREAARSRAKALLSLDPVQREKNEKRARFYEATIRIFNKTLSHS